MVDCISLFSGGGGLDIGAERAGANIIACVENDRDSAQTLRLNNHNDNKLIIEQDIAEVSFKEYHRAKKPLVVMGGPPCQPFSKNGYWVKNENRLIEKDPRNMLSKFLRTLKESGASAFLFENENAVRTQCICGKQKAMHTRGAEQRCRFGGDSRIAQCPKGNGDSLGCHLAR